MALSDVRDYLLCVEVDTTKSDQIAEKTALKLQSREVTLLQVVQSLGEYINNDDSRIRGRAVSYLAAVLSNLPPKFLSRQQLDVLCQFFSDRIQDSGAIEGLTELQTLDRFTADMAQTVVRAIFIHFPDFRSRPQAGRYRVLELLSHLMSGHRKGLHMMGDEALVGFANLVSGEKDPRNLMLVFSMCRVLMLEWDISNHAETMFDTVYAYFPITFRPPPDHPYGITAHDLKERLRDCIASTKHIAPYAIPNLLDKLDSTSSAVKKDVLNTLFTCTQSYGASCISRYSIPLWDSLKFEVLNAQEPELAQDTLVVLQAIATCLSTSSQTSPTASPLAQYIRPITKECIEHLQEPAHRQARASGDILKSVSSASSDSFNLVIKAVLAPIMTIYQSASEIANRQALLDVLGRLFDAATDVLGTWAFKPAISPADNPIGAFSETLLHIFNQALMGTAKEEVAFRVTAAQGLQKLAVMRNLLQENEIGIIVQHFDELVLHGASHGRGDLERTAMDCLAEISKQKPRLVMDITFPAFMAQLPDTDLEAEARGDYRTTLEGLAEISIETEVFNTLARRLLNKLDILLSTNNISTPRYTVALLSTLLFVMGKRGPEDAIHLQGFFDRIVAGLVPKATIAANEGKNLTALNDAAVLEVLGRLSNLIIRHSTPEQKAVACSNVYNLFSLHSGLDTLCQAQDGSELRKVWILSTWLLAAVPRDMQAPLLETQNISYILPRLLGLLKEDSLAVSTIAILRQVALFINKHLPCSSLEIAVTQLRVLYTGLPCSSGQAPVNAQIESQANTFWLVRAIFVVTKALVLRLSRPTNAALEDLISLLDSSKYSAFVNKIASSSFGILLAPDAVLCKENGAEIRFLAPQKVFFHLIPLISAGFRSLSLGTEKESHLTALSAVLSTVPSDIAVAELPMLFPLLLQSLDLSDQHVKTSTLETLTAFILGNPSAVAESGHIPSLIRRLLGISSSSTTNITTTSKVRPVATMPSRPQPDSQIQPLPPSSAKARQLATYCLRLMPSHITASDSPSRPNPLLPLKSDVLQGLTKVLDDPKRDVRKEAVDARSAWLRGVDDEDDDEGGE